MGSGYVDWENLGDSLEMYSDKDDGEKGDGDKDDGNKVKDTSFSTKPRYSVG